jgi:hypothetical protein
MFAFWFTPILISLIFFSTFAQVRQLSLRQVATPVTPLAIFRRSGLRRSAYLSSDHLVKSLTLQVFTLQLCGKLKYRYRKSTCHRYFYRYRYRYFYRFRYFGSTGTDEPIFFIFRYLVLVLSKPEYRNRYRRYRFVLVPGTGF